MAADDLNAPLGQRRKSGRGTIRIPAAGIIAGALALFLGVFVLWSAVSDDPFGGEPVAVVPIHLQPATAAGTSGTALSHEAAIGPGGPGRYDGPAPAKAPAAQANDTAAPGTTTVNIINGATGARQEVTIPAPGSTTGSPIGAGIDAKFVEVTPQGPIPKVATDGTRPADAFAQPVRAMPGDPDAPRIAIIVGGLGVSAKGTAEALAKLPGSVTLAFVPYGTDAAWVARARAEGHEVLLQVPMEPFDYPDNDPGPETLLTSLAPQQNMDRLHWLMSRFQGYVGLISMMGARFTASEQAFAPVLRETAKRGLMFVDDGSNPRSVAGRIAGANSLPFAKAELIVDSVPTPIEIDRALGRLEMAAREHHVAVGIASALPVSIASIAKWAKSAASRGVLLVPITAVALKDKQS
jgi:polysaccharide deacetylase 2 family uncharacterized protein YibQ